MIREATAMTVRQHLGDLLNEVRYRRGRIMITKAGKPVAALVDIETSERLRKSDEEFERLRAEMSEAFADWSADEVSALVDEAVEAARRHRARR